MGLETDVEDHLRQASISKKRNIGRFGKCGDARKEAGRF